MDEPFVVILAGGRGTRLSEETVVRPKPMVEIGGRPVLWHIMRLYSFHGFHKFIICLGYKGEIIKDYFIDYLWRTHDVMVDIPSGHVEVVYGPQAEPWQVWLIDTGESTNTGGRLRRLAQLNLPIDTFLMTYGDGLSDVNVRQVWDYHHSHGKTATVTCAAPPGRFGSVQVDSSGEVTSFAEKTVGGDGRVNAGFFVLDQEVLGMVENDSSSFEYEVLPVLAADHQLMAYQHDGFWKPMDTARDRDELQAMWDQGRAPWRV